MLRRVLASLCYLKDGELDLFYIFTALRAVGLGLVGVFIPVYLWKIGYELWEIIGFHALISAFFIVALLLLPPVLRGRSHRLLMGLSVPALGAFFFGLTFLPEYPVLFWVLPLAMMFGKMLFDISYHTNFSRVADDGFIGRQTGFLSVLNGIVGVVTPFLGAVIATVFGFPALFFTAIGALVVSLLLFCALKTYPISCDFSVREVHDVIFKQMPRRFAFVHLSYGAEYLPHAILWPLFLFLTIDNLEAFGALISLGAFVTMFFQYAGGHLFDNGSGRVITLFSSISLSAVGVLRAITVALPLPALAAGVHVSGKVSHGAVTLSYAQENVPRIKHAEAPAVFSAGMVFLWHVARLASCLVLMGLAMVLPMTAFFITTFVLGAVVVLVYSQVRAPHFNTPQGQAAS